MVDVQALFFAYFCVFVTGTHVQTLSVTCLTPQAQPEREHRDAQHTRVPGTRTTRLRACNGIQAREICFGFALRRMARFEYESTDQACRISRRPTSGTFGTEQHAAHLAPSCQTGQGAQPQTPAYELRCYCAGTYIAQAATHLLLLNVTVQVLKLVTQAFQRAKCETLLILLTHVGLAMVAANKVKGHSHRGSSAAVGTTRRAAEQRVCALLWSSLPQALLRPSEARVS